MEMEWEPLYNNECNEPGYNVYNNDNSSTSTTTAPAGKSRTKVGDSGDDLTTLTGEFEEHDVLLNGGRFSNLFKGNVFYGEQLGLLRPLYRQGADEQQQIVQLLLDSIWARDGRFLLLEPQSGIISLAPNATASRLVRSDLKRGPNNKRQHEVKQEYKNLITRQRTKGSINALVSPRKKTANAGIISSTDDTPKQKKKPQSAGKPTVEETGRKRIWRRRQTKNS